jgi:hypothetical protein
MFSDILERLNSGVSLPSRTVEASSWISKEFDR